MPVSALVLTLPQDTAARVTALALLNADARVQLGERRGLRLAVVTETGDPLEDSALFEELASLEGVVVDLVSYDFSDVSSSVASIAQRRPRRDFNTEGG